MTRVYERLGNIERFVQRDPDLVWPNAAKDDPEQVLMEAFDRVRDQRDNARPRSRKLMTVERAQSLAEELYLDRRDKRGFPELDHIAAVAAGVSDRAKAVAWMHDAVEDHLISYLQMYQEMSADQYEALLLLTRERGRKLDYTPYIAQIAVAGGLAGEIAREVKLADIHHNMTRKAPPDMEGMQQPGGRYDRAEQIILRAIAERELQKGTQ